MLWSLFSSDQCKENPLVAHIHGFLNFFGCSSLSVLPFLFERCFAAL